jgi:hypothetical protein
LNEKVAAPRLTAVGIRCAGHVTPSTRKSRHYFADSGGRSVGIVRLRTKATEFSLIGLLWVSRKVRENYEDLDISESIILQWNLEE